MRHNGDFVYCILPLNCDWGESGMKNTTGERKNDKNDGKKYDAALLGFLQQPIFSYLDLAELFSRAVQKFDELLNVKDDRGADIVDVGGVARMPVFGERLVVDITREEVQEAVEVMKAWKTLGLGGVVTECLKG